MKGAIVALIFGILAGLGLLAVSICGIVYGSIGVAHGIVNAKSVCFIVFGCIGTLLFGPSIKIGVDVG